MPQTNNFLFKTLNKEQLQAVKHVYGPLLVVAGAGSGKTKALTHRIANLIENNSIDPYNILAVTFTNNCLLYTSPSPRDDGVSRMPSSA